MKNNFDRIAGIYDFLAQLVFGPAIRQSQIDNLRYLNKKDRVLILGGGTGWILEEIDKLKITFYVTYVDSSQVMISKSKQRDYGDQINIDFICGDENYIPQGKYDVIITNFFLDVFDEKRLSSIILLLKDKLNFNGTWLFTDFVNSSQLYHKFLLSIMFWFFRITTKLESHSLPDFNKYFKDQGFKKVTSEHYFNGMIQSAVYT